MRRYIIIRLLQVPIILFGLSIIAFLLVRVLPGDVATSILVGPSGTGTPTQEQIDQLNTQLGLDRPLPEQYVDWAKNAVLGDLGISLTNGKPITDNIREALPITLELVVLSLVLALLIGVPTGIFAGLHQDHLVDIALRSTAFVVYAAPSFWIAVAVLTFLTIEFKWVPPFGYAPFYEEPWKHTQQMVWPIGIMGLHQGSIIARIMRATFLDTFRKDYVRTAISKGLKLSTVITRHVAKNAAIPVITMTGLQFAILMGGTVIQESIWNLPGIGRLTITAIQQRDYPTIQAMILLFGLVVLLTNLAVDLSYAWLNPRVRYQ